MKKASIFVITVVLVVAALIGGCRAAPTTPTTPTTPTAPMTAADVPELEGKCRPDLAIGYGEPFAFKPDGTPFTISIDYAILACEEMVNYEGVLRTHFTQAGMEYSLFDSEFNADQQVAFLEDLAAVNPPDIAVHHPVTELASVSVVDTLASKGVLNYNFDLPLFTDSVISYVHHWFEGPAEAGGGGLCGEKWIEIAEQQNKDFTILDIWCNRAALWSKQRNDALTNYVSGHPNITVIESMDNGGSEEITAEIVIDNLTANPEINGIYMQCGGQAGVISGLRAIDKLKPIGDPEHVTIVTFEGALPVMAEMEKGNIDYVMTHGPWDVCDTVSKVVLWNAVCGVDMPQNIVLPMYLLDADTLNSTDHFMYGALYWTQMPPAQWEIWPVLDTETPGSLVLLPENLRANYYGDYTRWQLAAPSLEARQANMGY
jgi:ABC-type sugar transport system substrate-binding protein